MHASAILPCHSDMQRASNLCQRLGFWQLLVDLLREVLLGLQRSIRHGGDVSSEPLTTLENMYRGQRLTQSFPSQKCCRWAALSVQGQLC